MKRAERRGLARTALAASGNVGTAEDVPALEAALAHDEPLVRDHAGWALGRLRHLGGWRASVAVARLRAVRPL